MLRLSPLSSGKFGASFHVLRLFVGQPTQPSNIAKRVLRPHRSRSRTSAFDFTVFISVAPFVWTFPFFNWPQKPPHPMAFNVEIGAKIIDRSTSAPNVIKIRAFGALVVAN